jgi:hypothetical protein
MGHASAVEHPPRKTHVVVSDMNGKLPEISRISKFFLDRDQITPEEAKARRASFVVTLVCGADVARSYTLQLAVLTAARIAKRCFPGAVRIVLDPALYVAGLLLWPALKLTLVGALADIVGENALAKLGGTDLPNVIVFGNAPAPSSALRVTFDGWVAKVGPASQMQRLPEREYCSLAGVLAAALALSETFLAFAGVHIEARRRVLAFSLWRPDLKADDPNALGLPVQFLPQELWLLGLGHLGNAYAWSLATMPYEDPRKAVFALFDFDRVEIDNFETGLLFENGHEDHLKTRVCSEWLEALGFKTKLIERRFDSTFRCQDKEPKLALCGFDSNPARRDLAVAKFSRVVESGLGGTTDNFDAVGFHTLPNPRSVDALWRDLSSEEMAAQQREQKRIAATNPGYANLSKDDCGRFDLAGKSIAVPFVGAFAGTLVVAETLRIAHDGAMFTDMKLRLSNLDKRLVYPARHYNAADTAGLMFCNVRILHNEALSA